VQLFFFIVFPFTNCFLFFVFSVANTRFPQTRKKNICGQILGGGRIQVGAFAPLAPPPWLRPWLAVSSNPLPVSRLYGMTQEGYAIFAPVLKQ